MKENNNEPTYKDFEEAFEIMYNFLTSMRINGYFVPGSLINHQQIDHVNNLRKIKTFVEDSIKEKDEFQIKFKAMKNYECDYCAKEKKDNPNLLYVTSVTRTSICEDCLQIAIDKLKEKKTDVDLIQIYKEKNKIEEEIKRKKEIQESGKLYYYFKKFGVPIIFLISLFVTIKFIVNLVRLLF